MNTELIVTIILAISGWFWAIIQFLANRRWQKRDFLQQQRYDAYKGFMSKMDSISEAMRDDPTKSLFSMVREFMSSLVSKMTSESYDQSEIMLSFTNKLLEQTRRNCEPLQQINGEINNIKLIASEKLLEKLDELQELNVDLYNEMMLALNAIGKEQAPNIDNLKTVGQQERWKRFQPLYDDIRRIMRKEVGIE